MTLLFCHFTKVTHKSDENINTLFNRIGLQLAEFLLLEAVKTA